MTQKVEILSGFFTCCECRELFYRQPNAQGGHDERKVKEEECGGSDCPMNICSPCYKKVTKKPSK
ncbi:hypothetical protein HON36_04130 [Candidatus Parcubacteria bacterium]|jgi:hypothetical protein|nr:hypothetical protein [Candidatus Parcubacteria bacterium]